MRGLDELKKKEWTCTCHVEQWPSPSSWCHKGWQWQDPNSEYKKSAFVRQSHDFFTFSKNQTNQDNFTCKSGAKNDRRYALLPDRKGTVTISINGTRKKRQSDELLLSVF